LKLLLLTHRVPYPPNRGDRIRAYHLLKFLSTRHEVSLACLADELFDSTTESELRRLTERLAIIPQSAAGKWFQAALAFTRGRTATSGLFASARLTKTIRQWTAKEKFDAVIAYCSSMAPYAFLPELSGTPKLVDLVDADSQKWLDYANQAQAVKRVLYGIEGRRLRAFENRLTQESSAIALVSEAEAELFRTICPNDRTHAILNGVDLEYFQSEESSEQIRPFSCVFVGALDYGANIDALEWFCSAVWPEVKRLEPQASLELVGRCPTRSIQKLVELPGVSIAANVPDVRPYLRRASLAIAPLRIARGIQNKVLEAMSMGKAVVATAGAAAGLNFEAGVHFVQADTPQEWIAALQRLWASESERSRLGRAGRKYVETYHSWDSTLEPWESLLLACTQQHQATNSSQVSGSAARIHGIALGASHENGSMPESLHPVTGREQAK
jgi:polysaccharide biosynthesis protein PslH